LGERQEDCVGETLLASYSALVSHAIELWGINPGSGAILPCKAITPILGSPSTLRNPFLTDKPALTPHTKNLPYLKPDTEGL